MPDEKTAKQHWVYTIVPRPKQTDYWLKIGAAYPNSDGKGWNILLQALPLMWDGQCKIVIREANPKDKEGEEPEEAPKSKK